MALLLITCTLQKEKKVLEGSRHQVSQDVKDSLDKVKMAEDLKRALCGRLFKLRNGTGHYVIYDEELGLYYTYASRNMRTYTKAEAEERNKYKTLRKFSSCETDFLCDTATYIAIIGNEEYPVPQKDIVYNYNGTYKIVAGLPFLKLESSRTSSWTRPKQLVEEIIYYDDSVFVTVQEGRKDWKGNIESYYFYYYFDDTIPFGQSKFDRKQTEQKISFTDQCVEKYFREKKIKFELRPR